MEMQNKVLKASVFMQNINAPSFSNEFCLGVGQNKKSKFNNFLRFPYSAIV